MINVCLIGCGRMGMDHAKHIHYSMHANLYCVVDPIKQNAEKAALQYGAKVHDSVEEALADKNVNAVVIVSSTSTHADLIMASARAGYPIFCEKPIDLSLEKIDLCLDVVDEYQVPLFIGFNRRFDPSFRTLHGKIREGLIGPIELLCLSSRDAFLPGISYLRTSGGMFRDMTIHDFDMVRWLLNEEPVEVYAAGSCLVDRRLEEFGDVDTAMLTLKTQSGAICHINNTRRCVYGYDQRIEVFGAKGMLRARNITPTSVEYSTEEGILSDKPLPNFPERYSLAYQKELDIFFEDVVKGGKKPEVSGVEGRQAMVIAEAANQSLQEGKPVKIPLSLKKTTIGG